MIKHKLSLEKIYIFDLLIEVSECKTGNGIGESETELPGFGGFPVDETEPIKDTYTLQLCLYIVQTNHPKANGASFHYVGPLYY